MTKNKSLPERVRAALSKVEQVEEKKMFGSAGFMVDGKLCVSARNDRIMCRIDPDLHDTVFEQEGCSTVIMKGREYRGYVYVEAEALKTNAALQYWIDLALAYNKVLTKAEKKS